MSSQSQLYKNSFEAFLRNTDEKTVIRDELRSLITDRKVRDLLDIGAGNGDLAKPLSALVSRYTAVEKNPHFVQSLKNEGIAVCESLWPAKLEMGDTVESHQYDMVLLSHVISYERSAWKEMLREAWWHVTPKQGLMTLITYRGEDTEWTKVMKELGANQYYSAEAHKEKYGEILRFLSGIGRVHIKKVNSHVTVPEHLDQMLQALEFVYTDGREDRLADWEKIRGPFGKILSERYDANLPHSKKRLLFPRYQFPFPHFFINVEKDTDVYISYKYRGANMEFLQDMITSTESALHDQGMTTFCNLHADPYYQRNNFTTEQVFAHAYSELDASKQHLFVVHSEDKSEGMVAEMTRSLDQNRKVIIAKKAGIQASYLPQLPGIETLPWNNFEHLGAQLKSHSSFVKAV